LITVIFNIPESGRSVEVTEGETVAVRVGVALGLLVGDFVNVRVLVAVGPVGVKVGVFVTVGVGVGGPGQPSRALFDPMMSSSTRTSD
jgi:hypothetical protein